MSASPARLYASIALVAGPLVLALTPPFQVPDEPAHFLRAAQVADGHWVGERRGEESGGEVPVSVARSSMPFSRLLDPAARISAGELRSWLEGPRLDHAGPREFVAFSNTVRFSPVPYLPAAAAIAVARAGHATVGFSFYAARLCTLLAAVALIALSLRAAPPGVAWPLSLLALLPMSEALLSSLSADALTLAFAIANAALAARLAADGPARRARHVVFLVLTAAALALTKPIYALFGGATALVAGSLAPPRRRWTLLALAGVLPLALALAWSLTIDPLYVPMQTGFSVPAQEAWALSHPLAAAASIVRAVFYWRHANELIGVLGWLDAPVPPLVRLLEAVALVALPLVAGGLSVPRWTRVTTLFAALGMALLTGVAMLLTWTVPGAAEVEGVQGRYFLPLCALALLAVPPWPAARPLLRHAAALATGAGLLGALATLYTLYGRYWRPVF